MNLSDARIDGNLRVYAIGDVHGCLDELNALIGMIEADLKTFPVSEYEIVFLGDYVDRGPENKRVIDRMIELQASLHCCTFLLGNHDERVLAFLNNPDLVWDSMMKWGGAMTLAHYGIVPHLDETSYSVSRRFGEVLPDDHLEFFKSLRYSHQIGDYFFCHAGVRPGVSLEKQAEHDLIWIRYDFLEYQQPFEKIIVHGHTPVGAPEVEQNRINVDTRCYESGILTAVVLEGARQRFLQTSGYGEI